MRRLRLQSVLSHCTTCSSFCFYQVIYLYSDIPPRFIKTSQSKSFIENAATLQIFVEELKLTVL